MNFDVVVVGAGPAGSVAAKVLAERGRKVALVHYPTDRGARRVGESLPGSARPLLRELNLLNLVEKGPHLIAYGNCSSWGTDTLVTSDFIRDPSGPGWHLDRACFDESLRGAAIASGAEFFSDRDSVCGLLTIDASGRSAVVARERGIRRLSDDPLLAIYTWLERDRRDFDTRTLVEATEKGWWYTSRLRDESRILVFHTDAETAKGMLKDPDCWRRSLDETRHVKRAIRSINPLTPAQCIQAGGSRLERFADADFLAVGDAALVFDPLSSLGIFNALYTGMKAGETVDRSLNGEIEAIGEYTDRLEQIRAAYLRNHRATYREERRFPDSNFWRAAGRC